MAGSNVLNKYQLPQVPKALIKRKQERDVSALLFTLSTLSSPFPPRVKVHAGWPNQTATQRCRRAWDC